VNLQLRVWGWVARSGIVFSPEDIASLESFAAEVADAARAEGEAKGRAEGKAEGRAIGAAEEREAVAMSQAYRAAWNNGYAAGAGAEREACASDCRWYARLLHSAHSPQYALLEMERRIRARGERGT
jgi:hypothetical protein